MNNMYRNLTESEIQQLEVNNCRCDDWSLIKVKEAFNPVYVRDSAFSGNISLGVFENSFEFKGGVKKHSGIYRAVIHNCDIADNVLIENVHGYIANYSIGDNTIIQDVHKIAVTGQTAFGNGVPVSVFDETGGRDVLIHDRLSSHFAYIFALYRYKKGLIDKLRQMVKNYVAEVSSDKGNIGQFVQITNVGTITNVKIKDFATINGASRLHNGSVNSNRYASVKIGAQVILEDFIVSSGVAIDEGAMLTRCFVGQGSVIGHGYSAIDSLFFSNCQLENGEACAIFAGPYTVTHHKSTLLIGGMFSFMNAGSGSNQSNHMYKLGPLHYGIMERGGKTSSDSYLLWPAKIGAFSFVKGHHYSNPDLSDLPFSYLLEDSEGSVLVPARNLCTVGTVRDTDKFPKRDMRTDLHKSDQINFSLLNPYIIEKVFRGIEILTKLKKDTLDNPMYYTYQNCRIKSSALRQGIEIYRLAVDKYLGGRLISRLKDSEYNNIEELKTTLRPPTISMGDWLDISGLIAPQEKVDNLTDGIVDGEIFDINTLNKAFEDIHQNYPLYEWNYAWSKIKEYYSIPLEGFTLEAIISIIESWEKASVQLDEKIYEDARKEFSSAMQVSFGIDGTEQDRTQDFEQIRGRFEDNSFVLSVTEGMRQTQELANKLIQKLEKLK